MKPFDLVRYIRKFRLLIIACLLFSGVIAVLVLNYFQTYTASAIISYTNSQAVDGLAPDGTEIDTTEIYSAEVLNRVFERLNLNYSDYNIDDMRSRITVVPVRPENEAAVEEAKTSMGEELEGQPTEYIVSFTASSRDGGDLEIFARKFLDELLDVYIQQYGENHINRGTAVNDISKLGEQDYDYLEMAELLKKSISSTLSGLTGKEQDGTVFRSSKTGYTFEDLRREFDLLYEVETSDIFSYILENKVTKDREKLIAKYCNRINDYQQSNVVSSEQIDSINEVIDAYVNMMRESGNVDITYEYILDDVHDSYFRDEDDVAQRADQTVEYDVLLNNYVSARSSYEAALVDIAYCRYIIDIYSGIPAEQLSITAESVQAGETEGASEATVLEPVSNGGIDETAQAMIDSLALRLNELYAILEQTNSEYNEYAGAVNVKLVSGIAVAPGFQLWLYVGLIVVFFGLFGCMGAVAVGRLGDIFEYHIYMDKKAEMANRAACDRYIAAKRGKVLDDMFVCISIRATDIQQKNKEFGRDETDGMLKHLSSIVKNTFSGEENCFCGLNSVGQYVIFAEGIGFNRASVYMEQIQKKISEYNQTAVCAISYEAGIAEAKKEKTYQIRELMLKAMSLNNASQKMAKESFGEKSIVQEPVEQEKTMTEQENSQLKIQEQLEELKRRLRKHP